MYYCVELIGDIYLGPFSSKDEVCKCLWRLYKDSVDNEYIGDEDQIEDWNIIKSQMLADDYIELFKDKFLIEKVIVMSKPHI